MPLKNATVFEIYGFFNPAIPLNPSILGSNTSQLSGEFYVRSFREAYEQMWNACVNYITTGKIGK